MRMIACTSPRTAGELRVLGLDPDRHGPEIRARLGVVPQQDNLDNELTVRQNLQVYGRYFGLSRAQVKARATELLEFAQLTDRAERPGGAVVGRHEAPADDRPVAGERTGAAAARRTDHRPGPAGEDICCGTGCSASSSKASRSSSPRTTWTRPSSCATAWW
ncbi:hypothetical protein GCM10018954_083530 [Kutzneria kofuensis]